MKEFYYRWETDNRYYKVNLYQDLFNDWVVEKSWGSKFNSRRGGAIGSLSFL